MQQAHGTDIGTDQLWCRAAARFAREQKTGARVPPGGDPAEVVALTLPPAVRTVDLTHCPRLRRLRVLRHRLLQPQRRGQELGGIVRFGTQ